MQLGVRIGHGLLHRALNPLAGFLKDVADLGFLIVAQLKFLPQAINRIFGLSVAG